MSEIRISEELKHEIWMRALGRCEYCRSQARFAVQSFSVEHIVPRSREGPTNSENPALACQGCNNHKYRKTHAHDPVSGEIVPLFHPRRNLWREHFAWNEDASLIIGLSATGRAAVEALRLNRDGLVNLRRILFTAGEHPPSEP
jgi:hypothetical protein